MGDWLFCFLTLFKGGKMSKGIKTWSIIFISVVFSSYFLLGETDEYENRQPENQLHAFELPVEVYYIKIIPYPENAYLKPEEGIQKVFIPEVDLIEI